MPPHGLSYDMCPLTASLTGSLVNPHNQHWQSWAPLTGPLEQNERQSAPTRSSYAEVAYAQLG